jgi:uncharacterized iron-regulated membrane protein
MMKTLHRYLGLIMALFWLAQATTGVILAFRWEIEDALLAGARVPVSAAALGARIDAIAHERGPVASMWASAMAADRFDIFYTDARGIERAMRVDGAGRPLRDRPSNAVVEQGAIFDSLTTFHQSLFAGAAGKWIIGISGALLLSNLLFGLRLAWPRIGSWYRSLFKKPAGGVVARTYGWHRVIGLWGIVPAMLVIAGGVLLAFEDQLRGALDADIPVPSVSAPSALSGSVISPSRALAVALSRFPGASLSALELPQPDQPWYRVRVRAPGDLLRNWGTTTTFVDATDARVLSEHTARTASAARSFVDFIYPLHTGQIGGTAGRALLMLIGTWLITMIVLGLKLWYQRRAPRGVNHR